MRHKFFGAVSLYLFVLQVSPSIAHQIYGPMQTGHIRLVADSGTSSPAGMAIFGLRSNGVLINETSVASTAPIRSGRIFVDLGGPVNTAIAFANPGDQDLTISYYFTDSAGADFGAGNLVLPGNHQTAKFFNEPPFGLTSTVVGTFTFNSSGPVSAVALRSVVNERGEIVITTMPVSPLGSSFGGNTLQFAGFGEGPGWMTHVVLVNPADTQLSGTIQFFSPGSKNGNVQPTRAVVSGVTNSTFNYKIPPRSAVRMLAQSSKWGQIGSARITPAASNGTPSLQGIFSNQSGAVVVSEASGPALPGARAFRMYLESFGVFGELGSAQTAVSIANTSISRALIQLTASNFDGTPAGLTASVEIPAGGQVSKLANEFFPQLPATFRGVLRMTSNIPVNVVGLRAKYNERGERLLTISPPYDDGSTLPTEISFPHFVSGAGYFTQLILMATGAPQTGSLMLLSQEGVGLPGSILQPTP